MSEKILTKHPKGKKGVNINREKYEIVKASILKCLNTKALAHFELVKCVNHDLKGRFDGSINWYVETVKLDLEARNIIKRTTDTKPPLYMLKIAESSSRITP